VTAELDVVFRARRAVTAAGEVARCIGVTDGRIVAIEPYESPLTAERTVELDGDVVLLPGLVDTHVHVNEPGRTEWEGFATATRAAAAGGITTIIDMPLNSIPPTVDVPALEIKRKAAEGQVLVDVGFWGGAIPGNLKDLRSLHDAGVFGFKCFLLHSGVPEFPHLGPAELEEYMAVLRTFGALLLVHAENDVAIERAPSAHGESYRTYLASRPRGAENVAIAQVIEAARWTGARVHILHLSSSDAIPMISTAQRDGVRITAETCPHFLVFTAEEILDGATQYKCCPPIREAENRELLWRALTEGVVDCGRTLGDIVRWMAERPARLAGLQRKGQIALGYDADLCAFAPDDAFVVDPAKLHHKNPITPYAGRPLAGVVRATWLRGDQVADGEVPRGRLLTRGGA
jgi:allantoinase